MKKLLIATDNFLPRLDGISSFLDELIPRLQDHFDITVLAPDFGETLSNYNAKLIKFKLLNLRLGDYYPSGIKLGRIISQVKKSDVVFVQSIGLIGIFTTIVAKIYRKPLIRYNHTMEWELFAKSLNSRMLKIPINLFTKLIGKFLYNLSTLILVSSSEYVELLRVIGIKAKKKVVHLGVDIQQYKPPASKAVAKDNLGIGPTTFVVGYAGRLGFEKDLKTLYRAFLRLSRKFDDVLLLIAGGGHPDIEKLFISKKNVFFTGPKNDLAPYYQAMDIYVLPSLTETTSLTTMEAMSTGCSVVVTPVGFIKEYINEGENGILFPKKNSYALYEKLKYLKENDAIREKLGRNARDTMVNDYNWEKTALRIKHMIDTIVSQG